MAKSCKLRNFCKHSHIFIITADFGLRRILWRHCNAHLVKESCFSVPKMEWTALRSLHARFTRSTSDKQTKSGNKSALLVWATWRRPFICLDRSRGLLSITRHHYTQRWEIQWSSRIHRESITSLSNLVRSYSYRYQSKCHWCGNQEKKCSINTNIYHSPWI